MRRGAKRGSASHDTGTRQDDASSSSELAPLLDELIATPAPSSEPDIPSPPSLVTAQLVAVGEEVRARWRGAKEAVAVEVAPEVERELLARTLDDRGWVLLEHAPHTRPIIVGVVQTRLSRDAILRGAAVTIEAEQEVLLRAGRAALRLRADGDVELVGTRISAASRGLFRLVGRILRLN